MREPWFPEVTASLWAGRPPPRRVVAVRWGNTMGESPGTGGAACVVCGKGEPSGLIDRRLDGAEGEWKVKRRLAPQGGTAPIAFELTCPRCAAIDHHLRRLRWACRQSCIQEIRPRSAA